MKIGIDEGGYISRYGFEKGLEKMKAHGYDTLDFQEFVDTDNEIFFLNDGAFERNLLEKRAMAEAAGIEIIQAHGPWRWPPRDFSEEDRAERFEKMSRSIAGTKILGCKNFVIHPIMPFGDDSDPEPERLWEMNYEFMGRLADTAADNGITVCFENMPMTRLSLSTPAQILSFVKTLNRDNFKICLDTGHCAVFRMQPGEAVRLIGRELLQVLHVHDNNGYSDLHWIPYTGFIDWEDFSNALQEIGFEGSVSLETSVPGKIPGEFREQMELVLAGMARKIARL